MLNMGGIANFTYLPGNLNAEEVFTTDTGPGNTLIDAFTRKLFNKPYDADGRFAANGTVNRDLLQMLKKDSFFKAPFPKTTGPEVFNIDYVEQALQRSQADAPLKPEDLIATLTRFSAETIVEAIQKVIKPGEPYSVYRSGGGMHNPVLTGAIQELLPGFSLRQYRRAGHFRRREGGHSVCRSGKRSRCGWVYVVRQSAGRTHGFDGQSFISELT
jgi:anhydro-N-acetylmuramic acid kinase